MPTILKEISTSPTISGKTFAIQGLGSVGAKLAELILDSGGFVFASDIDESRLKKFHGVSGFRAVHPFDILSLRVNVLCPCGPACVINPDTIPDIKADAIAGVANCVLEDEAFDDRLLMRKGILLVPDFVLNAGGVMQGISEHRGRGLQDAIDKLPIIQKNLRKVFRKAKEERIGTMAAAKSIAIARREAMGRCNGHRKGQVPAARG
jgi:leucine dehydrogenase